MKQIWVTKKGAPEVLQLRDVPEPEPAEQEVRILVKAAGVNFADNVIRMGLYPGAPKPPMVLGFEVSGVVDKVGAQVKQLREGERVMGFLARLGGYSEKVVLPASDIVPIPAPLGFEQAAALPVVYVTAWMMLMRLANLQPGETVLIHSAGGGVGLAAHQICKWRGAQTIGSASAAKHARMRELGYSHCIDYKTQNIEAEVKRITQGNGVDVVLDPNGGRSFSAGYRMLAPLGRLVIYGISSMVPGKKANLIAAIKGLISMPRFKPMDMLSNNKSVMGFWLGRPGVGAEKLRPEFERIAKLAADRVLEPIVDKAFPFSEAAAAHHYMQDHRNFGKLVLVP